MVFCAFNFIFTTKQDFGVRLSERSLQVFETSYLVWGKYTLKTYLTLTLVLMGSVFRYSFEILKIYRF